MKTKELIMVASLRADSALMALTNRRHALENGQGMLAQGNYLLARHNVTLARAAVAAAEKQLGKGKGGRK